MGRTQKSGGLDIEQLTGIIKTTVESSVTTAMQPFVIKVESHEQSLNGTKGNPGGMTKDVQELIRWKDNISGRIALISGGVVAGGISVYHAVIKFLESPIGKVK